MLYNPFKNHIINTKIEAQNASQEYQTDSKKQLKKDRPDWHRLTEKEKKALAKQVTEAVVNDYGFKQEIEAPVEELIGIDDQIINKA